MTVASDTGIGLKRSPWLSMWLTPGDTVERVLAAKPPLFRLLLPAAGGNAALIVSAAIGDDVTVALLDWRMLASLAAAATVLALVNVHLHALLLSWSGRILGGRASPAQMRAVVAWSMAPLCAALALSLLMITGLRFIAGSDAAGPASAVIVVARRVTGVAAATWAIAAGLIMIRRVQAFGWTRAIFNLAAGSALLLLAVLPVSAFLFEPFTMPGGAMMPTVLGGDQVLVSKYAYGYSPFALPFSLLDVDARILAVEPRRGDVAAFLGPQDSSIAYLRRIVGLPGDRIQMKDGILIINDVPVQRESAEDFIDEDTGEHIKRWRDTLPNGVRYSVIDLLGSGVLDNTQVYTVPAGHYFVLGDNLDNSTDSRMLSAIGYVPFENLIGRAEFVWLSVSREEGTPPGIRFGRIGRRVR